MHIHIFGSVLEISKALQTHHIQNEMNPLPLQPVPASPFGSPVSEPSSISSQSPGQSHDPPSSSCLLSLPCFG